MKHESGIDVLFGRRQRRLRGPGRRGNAGRWRLETRAEEGLEGWSELTALLRGEDNIVLDTWGSLGLGKRLGKALVRELWERSPESREEMLILTPPGLVGGFRARWPQAMVSAPERAAEDLATRYAGQEPKLLVVLYPWSRNEAPIMPLIESSERLIATRSLGSFPRTLAELPCRPGIHRAASPVRLLRDRVRDREL